MNMKKRSLMPLVVAIYCVLVGAAFADPGAAFYDIQDQTCSEFAIFGQDPSVDSASVEFLSSNINAGFLIFDNFTGVTGTIQQVSWWGTTGYNSLEGMLPSNCLPSTFWIVFRSYDPGWPDFPGAIEAVYKVTASVEETGQIYSDYYQRKYKATINPPLNLSDGWISIVGNAEIEEECWFMWQDAGEGNSVVFETDGGYWNQTPYDHAFCLESVTDQPGACCYVSGITTNCTSAADQSECDQYPGGTFHPGATCDDDDSNDIADICEQMQEEGACCYLDGYETKCLVIDMEQCEEIYLGDFYYGETCADNNGNETADICEPPPVGGACCYMSGPYMMCTETEDEEECSQYSSSTFYPNETCYDDDGNEIADICEGGSQSGACCYWAGSTNMCVETQDEEECSQYSSSTFYPGETCYDDDGNEIADICEGGSQSGACCYWAGSTNMCVETQDEEECSQYSSSTFYPGETCYDDDGNEIADICEGGSQSGACCYWAGSTNMCVETQDEEECSQYSSSTFYPGETCYDDDGNEIADICEGGSQSGACCYWAGSTNMCVETQDEEECSQYSSSTFYPGETCYDDDGNEIADICEEPSIYDYLPGDANMAAGSWPPNVIGADVTYLVNYFRAIAAPCLVGGFYNSADANGDCSVIGADVTYLVQYFRGANELHFCPDYEPSWQSSGDLPAEAPDGWPNCE